MKNAKLWLAAAFIGASFNTGAVAADMNAKAPSAATKAAHEKVFDRLPFENTEDFKLATRGQLAKPEALVINCLLYTSPSPRDATLSRMPSSA